MKRGREREDEWGGERVGGREGKTSNEINRMREGGRMMDFHRGAHITTMESFGVT